MQNTDFKYRVAQVMAGEYPKRDSVPVCDTPELIQKIGFSGSKIVMEQRKIRRCLAPEETAPSGIRHHDLPIDFMDNLPQYVAEPAMILLSHSHPNDSVVLVTDCKDKKGDPIIISLRDEGKLGIVDGAVVTYDKLSSAYGKEDFAGFLKRSIVANGSNNGLLYWNEKKSRDLAVSAGLDLPRVLANHDSNVIIRRYNENVNPLSQNNLDFLSPDGYGKTLPRADGEPFAYSDPDGRQKLYEYTKGRDGKDVLSSTTATFSNGHSEITRYDERGGVVGITRKDASGRTTYNYSRKWNGEQREVSCEYFETKYQYSYEEYEYSIPPCKSVHEKTHEITEGRYQDYHKYKEDWHEYDGRGSEYDKNGNTTLSKHNEYRDDGFTPQEYYCGEDRYEYDCYGNRTSRISKNHDGIEIVKQEYYSSGEWYDYYGLTPEDTDGEFQTPDKSRIHRRADGSISIAKYEIDGDHTELEFSSDGKISRFRAQDGTVTTGSAAKLAVVRSGCMGSMPSFAELKETTKSARPSQPGKGKSGSGSGGSSSGSGR